MAIKSKHTALLLVEGETEVEFYDCLANKKFRGVPKQIKNLKGNFNINNKIIEAAYRFSENNKDKSFDVYVCVDQERVNTPPFNEKYVSGELGKIENFNNLHPVIANLMIESLFFIDIDGIYKFLRAEKTQRNPKKYANFRILKHQDLSKLFKSCKHSYSKGIRCQGLVSALDMEKICKTAGEIALLVEAVMNKGKVKAKIV